MENRDKHKENGIILERGNLLNLSKEVMRMAVNDPELLNAVYREVSEKMGMDAAMEIYQMFKGQQISFPTRFFNPAKIQQIIVQEYDGTNTRTLAIKYGYSEKTIRRLIKESLSMTCPFEFFRKQLRMLPEMCLSRRLRRLQP